MVEPCAVTRAVEHAGDQAAVRELEEPRVAAKVRFLERTRSVELVSSSPLVSLRLHILNFPFESLSESSSKRSIYYQDSLYVEKLWQLMFPN